MSLMKIINTDVFVLGAGAAGFGACYALTKNKIHCVCADINPGFGGNAVYSGVCCFEPGVSLRGVHTRLAEILLKNGGGQVQKSVPSNRVFLEEKFVDNFCEPLISSGTNWGLSVESPDDYASTLKRCQSLCTSSADWRRFMTDEEFLGDAMDGLIAENSEYFTGLFGYCYSSCKTEKDKILSVTVTNGYEKIQVTAKYFLDCSGSIVFARDAGCEYTSGDNGDISSVNGATLVFRVTKNKAKKLNLHSEADVSDWIENRMRQTVSCFNMYPNGDINVNMLPTISGAELLELGDKAYETALARVIKYWEFLQKERGMSDYEICKVFRLGIREDYRLKGKQLLSLDDILAGIDPDKSYIAIADHPLDSHRVSGGSIKELPHPYGIPLECTETKEFNNMFVVCRGSSFSHVAASSARLTRTMISMGEGVAKHILNIL